MRSAKVPEREAWWSMRERCSKPSGRFWHRYGGRGITVCERWRESFENFLADMGPRPSPKHSLDRIDNNGNYEPGNCRWATSEEQQRNKGNANLITAQGVTMCAKAWSERTGLSYTTIASRIARGWGHEQAVSRVPSPRPRTRDRALGVATGIALALAIGSLGARAQRASVVAPVGDELLAARVCFVEAEFRLRDCAAIVYVLKARARRSGWTFARTAWAYSAIKGDNDRARFARELPGGPLEEWGHRDNRSWTAVQIVAALAMQSRAANPCPLARHWGGPSLAPDMRRAAKAVWEGRWRRVQCRGELANAFYAELPRASVVPAAEAVGRQ